ncbi:MAG: phosphatidylglycerophosphatase A [Alphaproteobacteria bacterium]|jgi:phosphatidylglycerophosphatase A
MLTFELIMEKSLKAKVNLLHPAHFLGFGFGSGLFPLMPGTMGSLAAIPLIIAMSYLAIIPYMIVTLIVAIVGIYICQKVTDDLGVHDHGAIVWDEIAGMMIVFIAVPISWHSLLIGFLLFRFFDIIKPWPISFLDKNVHGGWGIMVDDLVAGALSLICLHSIYFGLAYYEVTL